MKDSHVEKLQTNAFTKTTELVYIGKHPFYSMKSLEKVSFMVLVPLLLAVLPPLLALVVVAVAAVAAAGQVVLPLALELLPSSVVVLLVPLLVFFL